MNQNKEIWIKPILHNITKVVRTVVFIAIFEEFNRANTLKHLNCKCVTIFLSNYYNDMWLMDLEEKILRNIQKYLAGVPLLVVGSGASAPYGMPSMSDLATLLQEKISPSYSENKDWKIISQRLYDGIDLESALSDIHIVDENLTKDIVKTIWDYMQKKDLDFFNKYIISNNSQFSHIGLLNVLLKTNVKRVSVITTNYDRLFEYAAEACGVVYCCNFSGHYYGDQSNSVLYSNSQKIVQISKVHGSLDWFKVNNQYVKKMAQISDLNDNLEPMIITPGLEKYRIASEEPFRSFFSYADNEINGANSFLCIGYGFNDTHFHPKLKQNIEKGKPIVILTRSLSENCQKTIENATKYVLIQKGDDDNSSLIKSSDDDDIKINKPIWKIDQFLKWVW